MKAISAADGYVLAYLHFARAITRENEDAHDWFVPEFIGYECCRKCGIVRRADDKNKPCKGVVRVALRDEYTEAAAR